MFIIDTNVLSEIRRNSPTAVRWVRSVEIESLFLSVVTLGEIMRGITLKQATDPAMAARLYEWLMTIRRDFADRTLPVTEGVAIKWGQFSAGRSRGYPDGLIAATAAVHDFTVVTRNVSDFQDLPIAVLDPWTRSS